MHCTELHTQILHWMTLNRIINVLKISKSHKTDWPHSQILSEPEITLKVTLSNSNWWNIKGEKCF